MKKLCTVLLVLLAACHRGGVAGSETGASSPEAAVNAFLAAAKAQDLQALSAVWGSPRGAARNTMAREELEPRSLIMIRLMCQDGAKVGENTPGLEGRRTIRVDLTRGATALSVNFTAVQGPGSRWYVENFDNARLQAFCRSETPAPR